MIRNDDDGFNRHWACEKINDKDYLVKLIFNKSFYHRLDDLSLNSNLNCEEYFKEIYENSDDEYSCLVAAYLIQDEVYLANIVLNDSNDKIRLHAIKNKHFSNQEILKGKREDYDITAFGDSRGDQELLAYANTGFYKPFRER